MDNRITAISTTSYEERMDGLISLLQTNDAERDLENKFFRMYLDGGIAPEEIGQIESDVLRSLLLRYSVACDDHDVGLNSYPQIIIQFTESTRAYNIRIRLVRVVPKIVQEETISEDTLREYIEVFHQSFTDSMGRKVPNFTGTYPCPLKPCKK